MFERGVALAEVVDGDQGAESLERLQLCHGAGEVAECGTLGDFEAERARPHSLQDRLEVVEQPGVVEARCTQVDEEAEVRVL